MPDLYLACKRQESHQESLDHHDSLHGNDGFSAVKALNQHAAR